MEDITGITYFSPLGINTGLRVSDFLKLKYDDVLDNKGKFKNHISIKEKKNSKPKAFPINETAKKAITLYLEKTGETGLNGYIFTSRKGENKPITGKELGE